MEEVRPSLAYRIKSSYAVAMRGVGRVLVAAHVLPAEPPSRDRRLRHWLVSVTRVHDSLGLADLDVPWWTYRAIDVVDAWLSTRPHPIRVFEYGSGASTVWLARRADEVVTVEHHMGFADHMTSVLSTLPQVSVLRRPGVRSASPRIGSRKAGHDGLDFTDYVESIRAQDGRFDLVVIDGRAREACLRTAVDKLADGGLIVFDNSRRQRYRRAIEASGLAERRLAGLTPTLPYPEQTSLLTRA